MKNAKKILFSLILLLLAVVSVRLLLDDRVVSAAAPTYTVTFDYNTSTLSKNLSSATKAIDDYTYNVAEGDLVSHTLNSDDAMNVNFIRSCYTLEWYVGGNKVNPDTYPITSDTTFVAKWTAITFTIRFHYNDTPESAAEGKVDDIRFTVDTGRINYVRPTREHYYFMDWYDNASFKETMHSLKIYKVAGHIGDIDIYARWSPIEYPIHYHTDADITGNPDTYNVEDDDIILSAPTKEGHIFKGWYWDSALTSKAEKIEKGTSGELDLYPKWELVTYKVTYILPDGTRSVVMCEHGKKASLPSDLDRSIFEIVKTDVSRDNITSNVRINIELVNIWYVYVIGLVLVAGIIAIIIFIKKKRENRFVGLRRTYQSNTSRYSATSKTIPQNKGSYKRRK